MLSGCVERARALEAAVLRGRLGAVHEALSAGVEDLVPALIAAQRCIVVDGKRMEPEAVLGAVCGAWLMHRGDLVADVLAGPAPPACHVAMMLHTQYGLPVAPRHLEVAAEQGHTGMLRYYLSRLRGQLEHDTLQRAARAAAAAGQSECAALLRGAGPCV